ncbi:response regulator transcription factor [Nocardioides anomalus]|uniref:Response regulator transcription factor n=2 Tax=Nocardioides anomalus TaxID=2712223 RepID=A0A6G6WLD1_9ACTN|nr:response regulator transcription factor [Nocardioides anomalus]
MVARHRGRVEVVALGDSSGPPDVLLRDTFGLSGDVQDEHRAPSTRLVAFTAADDARAVAHALEQGVAGYVHKSVSEPELIEAIERVHAGEQVVLRRSGGGRRGAVGTVDWPGRAHGLSDREAEVLVLICKGMSNAEVAEALYLSVNSVKTYIRTLYRKIGAQSRSQAVIWGLQHGFTGRAVSARSH